MPLRIRVPEKEYQYLPAIAGDRIIFNADRAWIDHIAVQYTQVEFICRRKNGVSGYLRGLNKAGGANRLFSFNISPAGAGIETLANLFFAVGDSYAKFESKTKARITLKLSFNPLRFYQALKSVSSLDRIDMYKRTNSYPRLECASRLSVEPDKNNNFITGRRVNELPDFAALTANYVDICQDAICREFTKESPASKSPSTFHLTSPKFGGLEVCWDFQTENAHKFIEIIKPLVERQVPKELKEKNRIGSSSSAYEVPLLKNLYLKLYAKTEKRVRFEIYFKGNVRGILNKAKNSIRTSAPNNDDIYGVNYIGYQFSKNTRIETQEELYRAAIFYATTRINQFFADISLNEARSTDIVGINAQNLTDLILSIYREAGGDEEFGKSSMITMRIVNELIKSPHIVKSDSLNTEVLESLTQKHRNILTRIRTGKRTSKPYRYKLTGKYSNLTKYFASLSPSQKNK